jgi:hypothetical protein
MKKSERDSFVESITVQAKETEDYVLVPTRTLESLYRTANDLADGLRAKIALFRDYQQTSQHESQVARRASLAEHGRACEAAVLGVVIVELEALVSATPVPAGATPLEQGATESAQESSSPSIIALPGDAPASIVSAHERDQILDICAAVECGHLRRVEALQQIEQLLNARNP